MTRESSVLRSVLLALGGQPDLVVFRNNTGMLNDATGRPVRYGLGTGSADIVGVLAPWGRFVAFEVKRPGGKPSAAQHQWADIVEDRGALYVVVTSDEDALKALDSMRVTCGREWGLRRLDRP